MTWAGAALVEDDRPERADAILVVGGDEFGTRIVKAAQLAQAGFAPYVVVSGPPVLLGYESEMMIEYARRQGYPVSIFRPLHHRANSTRQESAVVAQYLRDHQIHKLLLVTSNFHTRRAAKLMRLANRGVQVIVVAAADPVFSPQTWWKTRNGQKTFLYEWLKTVATSLGV